MLEKYLWYLAGGLFGGLLGQYISKEPMTPARRALHTICAMACAVFWTPVIARYYNIIDPEGIAAVAFGVGIFWLKLIEGLDNRIASLPLPWSKTK